MLVRSDLTFIHQSTIKHFLKKGEEKNECARKIKEVYLDKMHGEITSKVMNDGVYFESLCLGSGRDGKSVLDLPRRKLTQEEERNNIIALAEGREPIKGKMLMPQQRILAQYRRFKILCANKQITISKEINTQVTIYKRWSEDPNVILVGNLDIAPTTILLPSAHPYTKRKMNLASIDLKLTADIHSTWGDFCYGAPEHLDDIQGKMYHELVRDIDFELNDELNPDNMLRQLFPPFILEVIDANLYLFYLWIFCYKKEKLEDKMIEVTWDALKKRELFESIRKTLSTMKMNEAQGWLTNPMPDECNKCPIIGCKDRNEIETI